MDRNYVDTWKGPAIIEVERVEAFAYAVYVYATYPKVRISRQIFMGFWARRKAIARARELNAYYNPEPPVPCIAWSSEWRED